MKKTDVMNRLTAIFRTIFSDDSLVLTSELTPDDVEQWDSLSHMLLITEIENEFSIKFKLKDLNKMRNLDDMTNMILSKI